jgi:tight adherence protein C
MSIFFLSLLTATACSGVFLSLVWPLIDARAPTQTQYRPLFWRIFSLPVGMAESIVVPLLPNVLMSRLATLLNRSGLRLNLSAAGLAAGCIVSALLAVITVALMSKLFDLRYWQIIFVVIISMLMPALGVRSLAIKRESEILRQLPFFLDLITLAVESGLNLTSALSETVEKGPSGALEQEFSLVLRDMRAGMSRASALHALTDRVQLSAVKHFVGSLIAAEKQGASLGPLLRAQAAQRRNERFSHAEKLAMQAPVKMLFPLIAFIFPCTFIILFFPIFFKLAQEGWIK